TGVQTCALPISLRYALIRLVRIFLVLAYFAAKDAFKVERRRLDGGEVSVDSLLKVNMDFGYGSIPVDPDESVFLGQGCEFSCHSLLVGDKCVEEVIGEITVCSRSLVIERGT